MGQPSSCRLPSEDYLSISSAVTREEAIMPIVHCLTHDEDGATMVEYALLIMLIAMVAFAGVALFGTNLGALYNTFGGSI
jgi:Flp pilus assembly pilin Flp